MDQNGWEMHSLNYSVVQRLKKLDPKLPVGMILPGDFVGNPVTNADFYTMEYSFLTREQVESLNELRKGVYAWTVNDETGMVAAYSQGVQGEITDDATTLHAVMQDSDKARLMHQKLGRYIVNILAE
jgi:Glycerophosphoryl diester phosphodiesterase